MLRHAIDAISANEGVFFLDPHGSDITKLLDYVPPRRRGDVIYFDPTHALSVVRVFGTNGCLN